MFAREDIDKKQDLVNNVRILTDESNTELFRYQNRSPVWI